MRKKEKGQSIPPKVLKANRASKAKMWLLKFWNNYVPLEYFFERMKSYFFSKKNQDFGEKELNKIHQKVHFFIYKFDSSGFAFDFNPSKA